MILSRGVGAVPPASAYTHFLANLLTMEDQIRAMFDELVDKLREVLPDLGKYLAQDGKALPSVAPRSTNSEEPVRTR